MHSAPIVLTAVLLLAVPLVLAAGPAADVSEGAVISYQQQYGIEVRFPGQIDTVAADADGTAEFWLRSAVYDVTLLGVYFCAEPYLKDASAAYAFTCTGPVPDGDWYQFIVAGIDCDSYLVFDPDTLIVRDNTAPGFTDRTEAVLSTYPWLGLFLAVVAVELILAAANHYYGKRHNRD
ncbi:MAG: hypothetical protein PHI87_01990 [Candidatus Methanomethylophilus sp.]|nr:hypothetical protein [Methanomethylophilus sp.]